MTVAFQKTFQPSNHRRFAAEVIYFASPAEVLFDEKGQLKSSKEGLLSVAWRGGWEEKTEN